MLTIQKTAVQVSNSARTERETVAMRINTGNGSGYVINVPAVPLRGVEREQYISEQLRANAATSTMAEERHKRAIDSPENREPRCGWSGDAMNVPAGFVDFLDVRGYAWRTTAGAYAKSIPAEQCAPIDRHELRERYRVASANGEQPEPAEFGAGALPVDADGNPVAEPGSELFYTTAPADYDGFGTRTVRDNCGKNNMGKTWRLIQIRDDAYQWQNGRNGSGLHATVTVSDFRAFHHLYVEQPKPAPVPAPAPVEPEPVPAPPVAVVSEDIATAFGLNALPNVTTEPAPEVSPVPVPGIVDTIADELKKSEIRNAERELKRLREFDYKTNPAQWSPKTLAYYLETVCGVHVHTELKQPKNVAELSAMVLDEYRKRNTETASVVVNRSAFLNAVKTAKKLNPRNPAKTVSLSVNGSVDVITGDNDARFSQCLAYAKKSGELRLTFPEQQLTAIATKLKSETLELTLHSVPALSDNVLTVAGGSATFELSVERPDGETRFQTDFPAEFAHNVQAGDLLHALNLTIFATDSESTRYALAGLCFVPESNSLDIAATDSRRLAVETVPAELLGTMPELKKGETPQSRRFTVVPVGIIGILIDELKRIPETAVVSFAVAYAEYSRFRLSVPENLNPAARLAWENKRLIEPGIVRDDETGELFQLSTRPEFVFESAGAFSIRGVPSEGRFPRYTDVIPKTFESEFSVNRVELLNACETVELSTSKESRGVDFEFPAEQREPVLILRGKSETARGSFSCGCNVERGDGGTVATFDPQYIAEYLKRSRAERVRFKIIDSDSAVVITPENETGNGSGVHVVMPLSRDR